jgi:hypothetical protein
VPVRVSRMGYVALGIGAAIYGFAFGIFGEYQIVGFLTPLAVLLGVLLWVMPELKHPPVRLLCSMFTVFIYVLLCWPDYLASALPGIPWITGLRVIGVPMVLVLLLCSFGSPAFRARMSDIFDGERLIVRFAIAFMVIAGLSIFLSWDMTYSFQKYILACWSWFGAFMVACYFFSKPGNPTRFAYMMLYIAIFSILIGLYETRYRHLPWAGHIPSFLAIQDDNIKALLAGTARAATGTYRVQSKFSTSIGLGEFFGMALPFILYLLFTVRQLWAKVLIFITIPAALHVCIQTDSRLAFVSFVSSVMLYILFQAYLTWRNHKSNLFAPAVMLIYPMFMALFAVLAWTWPRLGNMIFGTGAQQYSTMARQAQWAMGWPKVFASPFGYGMGRSPNTLNYHAAGSGMQTIDSYFLGVLLEFGFIGFVVYYGMFLVGVYQGGQAAIRTKDKETLLLGAAAIGLVNYMISKSIYSQLENNPLAFVLLALIVVLLRRYKTETGELPALPDDPLLAARPRARQVPNYPGVPETA